MLSRHSLEFADRYREVVFRFGHGAANTGDQFKSGLHQLVPDARVLPGIGGHGELGEQLPGFLAQHLGLAVDQLDLPFDAERRAARRIPLDSHARPFRDFGYQISPGWYSPQTSRSASQTSPRVASARSASRSGYRTLPAPSAPDLSSEIA